MSLFEIICVTNRHLCSEPIENRVYKILSQGTADKVILREKDLSVHEYTDLARRVLTLCGKYRDKIILHSFPTACEELNCRRLHMPYSAAHNIRLGFEPEVLGFSVHSPAQAAECERLGADYVTAGHIFATDCKAGLEPRGLDFLRNVCGAVSIPVYAIGGICEQNIQSVRLAGAAGACMMSGFMR